MDYPDQYDMTRSDVVIPNEPALTRITIVMISMVLSKLVEWSSRQFLRKNVGSDMEITSMNFKTFPATYFANFSNGIGSLGGDPFWVII